MLSIALRDGRDRYAPGETLEGSLSWSLDHEPEALEVRLFWHTSGKGTRDVGVVDVLRLSRPGVASEGGTFRFLLPDGPYSFSGTLITLAWAVEAVVEPSLESAALGLVVSPTGREIVLTPLSTT